jgi:hypothetical protein
MNDKNNNDCGNDKNNTKNMGKEIRKILKQNKCNMLYALDDIDMDKGYIGIDLYFNPDKITMQQIIDYLHNCLKLEYIDNFRNVLNNNSEEIPFKTFMQQNNNQCNCNKNNDSNNDTEELIKTLVKENVDLWEKDYKKFEQYKNKKTLNIIKETWDEIKAFKFKDVLYIAIIFMIVLTITILIGNGLEYLLF